MDLEEKQIWSRALCQNIKDTGKRIYLKQSNPQQQLDSLWCSTKVHKGKHQASKEIIIDSLNKIFLSPFPGYRDKASDFKQSMTHLVVFPSDQTAGL